MVHAVVGKLLGPETGSQCRSGKTLKLNRALVSRSIVSKAPQKAKKVRNELAKRVRHEWSEGRNARLMAITEVF